MRYDPERHQRRSVRLPAWDYAGAGWYFVTIVTAGRECLFGEAEHDEVVLSVAGQIVDDQWRRTARVRMEVQLDLHVVMPNHMHAIIAINDPGDPLWDDDVALRHAMGQRRPLRRAPLSLGTIVGGFKGAVTRRIAKAWDAPGAVIWQRGYCEHIIRDDRDYDRIHDYILANPSRWHDDALHPAKPPFRP